MEEGLKEVGYGERHSSSASTFFQLVSSPPSPLSPIPTRWWWCGWASPPPPTDPETASERKNTGCGFLGGGGGGMNVWLAVA